VHAAVIAYAPTRDMGHDYLHFRGRSLHLHDTWIEVLRGLIQKHASPTAEMRHAFDHFMDEWAVICPGVSAGQAFDGFVHGDDAETRRLVLVAAIDSARAEVVANGDELSADFLNGIPRHPEHGSGDFTGPLASSMILVVLDKARALLEDAR
jgi:hypothetical protein